MIQSPLATGRLRNGEPSESQGAREAIQVSRCDSLLEFWAQAELGGSVVRLGKLSNEHSR